MSTQVKTRDPAKWSLKWLQIAKSHMRVEHDRDDDFICDKVAEAADQLEGYSDEKIIAAEVVWRPGYHNWLTPGPLSQYWTYPGCDWLHGYSGRGGYSLPDAIRPIQSFRAMIGGEDRSPAWRLVGDVSPGTFGRAFFVRAPGTITGWTEPSNSEWLFHVAVGFPDPDTTPPRIKNAVLRLAGHLYENREMVMGQGMMAPDFQSALGVLWRPRC